MAKSKTRRKSSADIQAEKFTVVPGIDFRSLILERLEKIGRSRYWLANNGMVDLAPNSVMRYLNGTHDAHGRAIGQMMCAVGLRVEAQAGFAA